MHFVNIEPYFGSETPIVHTVAGFAMVASLLLAVGLSFARRAPEKQKPESAKPEKKPRSMPPAEARKASEPPPPKPATKSFFDQDLPAVSGVDADDEEATFVGKVESLPILHFEDRDADDRDDHDEDEPYETPEVVLMCRDNIEPDEATSPQARILVTASGATDRGKKRRRNEDSYLMLHDHSVFAVADGMGGYNGGEVASSLAVDTVRETFERMSFDGDLQSKIPIPRRGRELACSLLEANRAVLAAARTKPELAQMGTTLVAARFSPNKQRVYVGNVGDSRCYRFRGNELEQLTTDHTMRLLGLEGLHGNELYRAIGVKQSVDIDLIVDIPQAEDVYLLCSDGLPKMATSEEIQAVLAAEHDLDIAAQRLIDLANAAGGRDNVTVVLVRVQERLGLGDGPTKSEVHGQSQLGTSNNETHSGAGSAE